MNTTKNSQQHKHVQLIPLPKRDEFTPFPDSLTGALHNKSLPFQHYTSQLPTSPTPSTLHKIYNELLSRANQSTAQNEKLSYNFVMTTEWMFISPRSKDDYIDNGHKIAVNSTGMVGLLLTKSEEQSQFVEEIGPLTILAFVGKPWN